MKQLIAPRNPVDERTSARHLARGTTTVPATGCPTTVTRRTRSRFPRLALLVSLLAAAMAGSPPSHAQASAADVDRPAVSGQQPLQLDHGERWPTDVTLREGMRRIRAVAGWIQNAEIGGPLSARQSRAAATSIEDSVAFIVEHPPRGAEIDANLHILLARVLAADGRLPQLLDALELYPRYFNDPEWQPLERNVSSDH